MGLYFFVWMVIAGATILIEDFRWKRRETLVTSIIFIILLMMLCFRFGQGTDFFTYQDIFYSVQDDFSEFPMYLLNQRFEFGWLLICNVFRTLHYEFEVFVFVHSLVEMLLIRRFLKMHGQWTPFSLMLIYPTIYMTYLVCLLRQGLVICLFLGILLPLLEEKKTLKYIVGVLLCATIHTGALIYLLLLLPNINYRVKTYQTLFIAAWVIGGFTLTSPGKAFLNMVTFGRLAYYINTDSGSLFAIIERLVSTMMVTYLFYLVKKSNKSISMERIRWLYCAYLMGQAVYGVFMGMSIVASRFGGYIRFVEIVLIPYCIFGLPKKERILTILAFIVFNSAMLYKNLGSYIDQGNYRNVSPITFPYVSVFNESEIYDYRSIT